MSTSKPLRQCAALPFRVVGGRTEVLLVTSRETRRWIIPKGWIEKDSKPDRMAAREAFEEAGVTGTVLKPPYGSYRYSKRLTSTKSVACEVVVYLLRVEEVLDDWPEKGERERAWMAPGAAALAISEGGLIEMLLRLALPAT